VASRVLIVDDNLELLENVREVLERAFQPDGSLEIVEAHDAKQGLALAKGRGFDVAIVDVKLPDASGLDLIAPLRAAMPRAEIVLLTGNATVESAIRALRAGAAGFVLKSFRPEELVATIQQALEKSELRREREKFERRYHALVHAAEVLILGVDEAGRVVFVNPKLSELVGTSEADALGLHFAESWVAETDRKRWASAVRDAMVGEPQSRLELGLVDRDGAVRRVEWHLSGVREDGPETPDHVYGIGVDVTAKRALEKRAANAEALNAMAPLALGLAHEIRNPLNAAVLELHLLGRAIDRVDDVSAQAPMRRRVGVVTEEIRRLERLLTEFLELARPRAPQREPIDLGRVVSEVLDLEAEAIDKSAVVLRRSIGERCFVVGDVEKLKQVVLNLVVNALDAMPDGGELAAEVRHANGEIELALSDAGKGVDPKILAEVFDPFFTTKPAGTGLGLAIVRKLVEQHGGRVTLKSRPDRGTVATVSLPAYDVDKSSAAAHEGPPRR
jgi:PAS domain S-box-containing protein